MTVTLKNKVSVVVPTGALKRAGFKRGQELEFKASGGVITIVPKAATSDDEYSPQQRRAIDRGIAASEKDYAAGKSYGPFGTAAEAIASIDANLRRRRVAAKKLKSASR